MKNKTKRKISLFILTLLTGFLFYLASFSWQNGRLPIGPSRMPLTLQERLATFIPKKEIVLDNSNPENLILLWKDLTIKIGEMENISQKVKTLQYLFPILQTRYKQIEYVDIRFAENITIKYLRNY